MTPWETLAEAPVDGGGVLRLLRRGGEYAIRSGSVELMNSRAHGSEEALAERACARIASRPAPRVLVGGLGMGFTLAAALRVLPRDARVDAVERVSEVIAWNRDLLGPLAGHPLRDPRVSVVAGDVAGVIGAAVATYDAILLDVDNGPAGLSAEGNAGLYVRAGLLAARRALRSGGVYALWSAGADRAFARRLQQAGFEVDEIPSRARDGGKGGRHTLWVASRPGA
jgi:spermidine synthase